MVSYFIIGWLAHLDSEALGQTKERKTALIMGLWVMMTKSLKMLTRLRRLPGGRCCCWLCLSLGSVGELAIKYTFSKVLLLGFRNLCFGKDSQV